MNKKYIVAIVLLLFVAGFFLFRDGEEDVSFEEVRRGNVVQEIFETGTTEKGEDINLSFTEGGRIESVFIREGDEVERGEIIAELDKEELKISLREARAGLVLAEAEHEKLVEGATKEELDIIKSAVRSAETELSSAKDNLKEVEKTTDEALKRAHENVATLLGDVFSGAKEVELGVREIADTYFSGLVVSETVSGRRSRDIIRRSVGKIEGYKDLVMEEELSFAEKEEALSEVKDELRTIISEIDNILNVADSDFYEDRFSDADREILRGYRRAVNTSLGETISLQGSISTTKVEADAKLTAARSAVESARNALDQAEKKLLQTKAAPRDADIRSARAAIDRAESGVELVESKIRNATLRSPVDGTISSVTAREGEVVSPGSPLAVLVPEEDIQITLDVYEGDIAKVKVGDPVSASFVAFPDEEFEGEVVSINPTGRLIDRVVYYEVKVVLDKYPENTFPGMTVDVTITTAKKENVLYLSERSVKEREGKHFVTVLENGEYKERRVETGIRGEGRLLEVISGLEEGDKVLVD